MGHSDDRLQGVFGISSRKMSRTIIARCATALIAFWGLRSFSEMAFGLKLMLTYTLDMRDFSESTPAFFFNYASIIGLIAAITHYALQILAPIARPIHTAR
jgi:hypothetical protein